MPPVVVSNSEKSSCQTWFGPVGSCANAALGELAAFAATAHHGPAAATDAALLLGAGYGLCILSGIREVEHLAPPGELGSLVGIFYSLAYAGLAIPYLLSLAASHLGYPTALLLAALAAALTLLLLVVQGRRHPTGPTPLSPAGAVVSHCLRYASRSAGRPPD